MFAPSRFLVLAVLTLSVRAASPAPGTPVLSAEPASFRIAGKAEKDGRVERVAIVGQPFRDAARVTTLRKPPYPWDIRVAVRTTGAIRSGDVLLASFSARRIESRQETGEALVGLVCEESGGEHRKLLELSSSVGTNWTRITAPFRADRNLAAGEAQLSLRFGYERQVIEVAAVELVNHGSQVRLEDLPRNVARYAGIEPDAPWRKAAAERIERIRKGDLRVAVTDAGGHAVTGAMVEVRMKRHAFAFGSAVSAQQLVGEGADADRYRDTIAKYFNKVVFENNLKWDAWLTNRTDGVAHRERTLRALDWLRERNIPVRGHVMVWPSWQYVPGFVAALKDRPQVLRAAIDAHIADQTATLRGRLSEWDVVNESYAHHDVLDVLGRDEMVRWFQLARQGDPDVRLFYNDYILFAGSGPGSPSQYFFDTVKFLKDRGAPIGGIGEQGHFGGNPAAPEQVLAAYDRFATLGLPIQISEFDIDTSDTDLQVAYMRDFMTASFSHPALTGILSWGFWEGRHWKPRAAMWAKDWTVRPHGQVWLDLVTRDWWTKADLATGADGRCTVRGFCGDYEVTVRSGTNAIMRTVSLTRSGADLGVNLP